MRKEYHGLDIEVIPFSNENVIVASGCTPDFEAFTLTDMGGGWSACKEGYDGSGNWIGRYNNVPD